jgi:hypothetical protein
VERERVTSVVCHTVSSSLHYLLPVRGGEGVSLMGSGGGAVEMPARGPGAQGGVREKTGDREMICVREETGDREMICVRE